MTVRINKHEHILPVFAIGAYCDIVQQMTEFVPIPELCERDTGRVNWNVQLPGYAHEEDIAVNRTAMKAMAVAAGFSPMTYVSTNGGVDRFVPNMTSHNESGEATASLGASKAAASWGSLGVEESKDAKFKLQQNWSDTPLYDLATPVVGAGTITVNTDPLHQRLSQAGKLHDTKAWAKGLDRELKRATCLAAVQRLAGKSAIKATVASGLVLGYNYELVGGVSTLHGMSELLALTGGETLGLYAVLAMYARGSLHGARLSTVLGVQIDRIATVGAIAGVSRLAKPAPSGR
jgi:hypothetical protein